MPIPSGSWSIFHSRRRTFGVTFTGIWSGCDCFGGQVRGAREKCADEPVAAANADAVIPLSGDQCAEANAARRCRRRRRRGAGTGHRKGALYCLLSTTTNKGLRSLEQAPGTRCRARDHVDFPGKGPQALSRAPLAPHNHHRGLADHGPGKLRGRRAAGAPAATQIPPSVAS